MPEPRERNGLQFKVDDISRRLERIEQLPVTEMRVDLNYLKSECGQIRREMREGFAQMRSELKEETGKQERALTWVIRTFVGACLTALVGILIYASTQSGAG